MSISKAKFIARFKCKPVQDDLKRVNCNTVGTIGHFSCGVCRKHKKPRFMCGCLKIKPELKNS